MGILGYLGFTFDFILALLTIMGTFRALGIINVLLATFVYYLESCVCPMPSDGGQPQLDFPSGLNNTTHHLLTFIIIVTGRTWLVCRSGISRLHAVTEAHRMTRFALDDVMYCGLWCGTYPYWNCLACLLTPHRGNFIAA